MNKDMQRNNTSSALNLEAVSTLDLIAELARRERIALRLALADALADDNGGHAGAFDNRIDVVGIKVKSNGV